MDIHRHKQLKAMTVPELKELVAAIEEHYREWERGKLPDEPPMTVAYNYAFAMKKLRAAGAVPRRTWRYVRK